MNDEEKRYLETLKQVLERAKNYSALDAIEKLEKENAELKERLQIESQSLHEQCEIVSKQIEQIEKMKVCGSCKYVVLSAHEEPCIHCSNCFACEDKKENKWELAE